MNTQKWEYLKCVDTSTFSIKIDGIKYANEVKFLNEKGKDSWQLVQGPTHMYPNYYFKRSIQ